MLYSVSCGRDGAVHLPPEAGSPGGDRTVGRVGTMPLAVERGRPAAQDRSQADDVQAVEDAHRSPRQACVAAGWFAGRPATDAPHLHDRARPGVQGEGCLLYTSDAA